MQAAEGRTLSRSSAPLGVRGAPLPASAEPSQDGDVGGGPAGQAPASDDLMEIGSCELEEVPKSTTRTSPETSARSRRRRLEQPAARAAWHGAWGPQPERPAASPVRSCPAPGPDDPGSPAPRLPFCLARPQFPRWDAGELSVRLQTGEGREAGSRDLLPGGPRGSPRSPRSLRHGVLGTFPTFYPDSKPCHLLTKWNGA